MSRRNIKENIVPNVFISPAVLLAILVMIYPLFYSFYISFTNYKFGTIDTRFIGLDNYVDILSDNVFYNSLYKTIIFVVAVVVFEIIAGMIMALILNRVNSRFSNFTKALLVIPWAIPGTIVSGMWRFIYLRDFGLINLFLRAIGFSGDVQWLGPKLAMFSIILAEVWRMSSAVGLILLSGLANIREELYEAAKIDGATNWTIFWKVTLPVLKPVFSIVVILRIIFSFQAIEVVYVLTKGGPGGATYLLPFYIWRVVFLDMRAGYGSAIAYIAAIIAGIFCLIYLILVRERESSYRNLTR